MVWEQALAFADKLKDLDAQFYHMYPQVSAQFDRLKALPRSYLADELFTREWTAFSFSEVAAELADAKLPESPRPDRCPSRAAFARILTCAMRAGSRSGKRSRRMPYMFGAWTIWAKAARFQATTEDDEIINANRVVVAVGFKYFKHLPAEVVQHVPPGRISHTCDLVSFAELHGKRCLILGGRQSAFEWAALIHEAGAAAVHVCHRHASIIGRALRLSCRADSDRNLQEIAA
jgi:cation diffusion facilitator CzcD-associated flavoprotein CzcO